MPLLKRIAARLMGFDGAYHRFTGKVTIEKFERSLRVERSTIARSDAFRQGATSGVETIETTAQKAHSEP